MVALICALLLALVAPWAAAKPWSPQDYPNPKKDVQACGRQGVQSAICDPNSVLTLEDANRVEGVIKEIYQGSTPYARHQCGDIGLEGYEVGGGSNSERACSAAACCQPAGRAAARHSARERAPSML